MQNLRRFVHRSAAALGGVVLLAGPVMAQGPAEPSASPLDVLESFAADFERDPAAAERRFTFGVRLEGAAEVGWHVMIEPLESAGPSPPPGVRHARVVVREGPPSEPTLVYVFHPDTLRLVHQRRLHVLTAAAKARSSDDAPLDLEAMPGYQGLAELGDYPVRLAFHFFTRGRPELVPWGDHAQSRVTHGANAGIFYYQEGFRSGWFLIRPGQHVNREARDQVNPFPSLFIVVEGEVRGRIGGEPITLRGGESVFIGSGVSHEFWNEDGPAAKGILLMFGEGA